MTTYLDIQHLTKSVGDRILFADISFSVAEGRRLGLIAKNGTGKTTLLNIIAGKDDYDSGSVVFHKDLRVGYLSQAPRYAPELTVLDACFAEAGELSALISRYERSLATPGNPNLHELMDEMERRGAWDFELRAKQILTKLNITDYNQPVAQLSGGQLKRVALANVLLTEADLLILDEPTNHLDLEMIEWLEAYLRRESKALLMVTHDRYFLNRVCDEIVEQARRRQEEQAARLEVKSGYIGSKIFEAQYVSKVFPGTTEKPEPLTILDNFYYNFSRFEKMGIVGNNGTGKSTFIKLLLGLVKPDSGRFVVGETVRFGYFSQEGMAFDQQMKVIDAVRQYAETIDLGGGRRLTAMQFLTHFLFPPERQQDYIYKLSGGEQRRLYLCTVLMRNPNFLILDEPTNDLDIQTLQILEAYLQDFRGCVIVVSHDRYFMDKVVDHLLVFKGDGRIDDFPGNYSQYRSWSLLQEKEIPAHISEKPKGEKHFEGEQKRKLSFKERKEMEALEAKIGLLEAEKAQLQAALCSGQLSVEALTEKSKRLPQLEEELDEKSMRWLELSEIDS